MLLSWNFLISDFKSIHFVFWKIFLNSVVNWLHAYTDQNTYWSKASVSLLVIQLSFLVI